jgi:hypothetical protein
VRRGEGEDASWLPRLPVKAPKWDSRQRHNGFALRAPIRNPTKADQLVTDKVLTKVHTRFFTDDGTLIMDGAVWPQIDRPDNQSTVGGRAVTQVNLVWGPDGEAFIDVQAHTLR